MDGTISVGMGAAPRIQLREDLIAELHLGHPIFENRPTKTRHTVTVVYDIGAVPGFGLRIGKRRKTWFLLVPHPRRNGSIRISLGHWPRMSLGEARAKATEATDFFRRGTAFQQFETFMQKRRRGMSSVENKRRVIEALHAGMTFRQAADYVGVEPKFAARVYMDEHVKRFK